MSDFKRRVKTIAKRLDLGEPDQVIIVTPPPFINPDAPSLLKRFPRLPGESDGEYLHRVNHAPLDESKLMPVEVINSGGITIQMPRRYKPEFEEAYS